MKKKTRTAITADDIRKTIEILKANNNPGELEIIIMPGSPTYEYLRQKGLIKRDGVIK